MTNHMSSSDAGKLAKFFSKENKRTLPITQKRFVSNLGFRLYQEWCMEHEQEGGLTSSFIGKHYGVWFTNFVNDETHYELERRGYHWDEPRKRFNTVDNWTYNAVRDQVLRGLTRCAIDLFKTCDEDLNPKEGDKRNLRQDLSAFTAGSA